MQRPYDPQYYPPPPRRRHSADCFRLLDLPAEIRFLIFELSFPSINDVSLHWPAPIPALLRVSKQFNIETRTAMKNWSPVHYVSEPTYLSAIPHPGAVKIEHICLSMFHDARIGVLRSGANTHTPPDDHQDLVLAWTNNMNRLPPFDTIKTITVDATPAPGWLRYDKPSWVRNLINDKPVAERFIYEHITVVSDLILTIAGFYTSVNLPHVSVELGGQYGQRSGAFPAYVQSRCQQLRQPVAFTGTVTLPARRQQNGAQMTIARAIGELYSTRSIPADRYRKLKPPITNARRRLLQFDYSPTSEFLFANCFDDHEFWTMQSLERLTDFALLNMDSATSSQQYGDRDDSRKRGTTTTTTVPRHVDISIPDFAHGTLVCSLAKDLGMTTGARHSWRRREIRVSMRYGVGVGGGGARGRQGGNFDAFARPLDQQASSLFSLMLVFAAAALFAGLLSSDGLGGRRRGR